MESISEIFQAGVTALEQSHLDVAQKNFEQVAEAPGNTHYAFPALYNLGEIAAQQKDWAKSSGYFLRAARLNPHDSDTWHNLSVVQAKAPAHRSSATEQILAHTGLNECLLALLLASIFLSHRCLAFWKQRKAAEPDVSTPVPMLLFVWIFVFIAASTASILKVVDLKTEKGVVIAAEAAVRTAPDATAAELTSLPAMTEVVVDDTAPGFFQVSAEGTSVRAGWIDAKDMMLISNGELW